MHIRVLFVFIVVVFFTECKETPTGQTTPDIDTGYFPLKINSWKIYDVQYINIDKPLNVFDTLSYQIKEEFANWFVDAQGDSVIFLKRYVRKDNTEKWEKTDNWLVGINNNLVIQTEENIKYVKLNFPIELYKKWNGNAFNMQDTLQTFFYQYTNVDSTELYNSLMFDKVITVTQKYKATQIDKISFKEKYQYGVGLIYKEEIDVYYELDNYNAPLEQRVKKGTFYYQKILDYGTN